MTESGIISPAPMTIEPKSAEWNYSTQKTDGSVSPSLSSSSEKPIPHYLRASAGSCHDFCKYGIKHASDLKKISRVYPASRDTNAIFGKELHQPDIMIHKGRKKKPELKPKKAHKKDNGFREPTVKEQKTPPETTLEVSKSPTVHSPISNLEHSTTLVNAPTNMDDKSYEEPADQTGSCEHISINFKTPSVLGGTLSDGDASVTHVEESSEESDVQKLLISPVHKLAESPMSVNLSPAEDSSGELVSLAQMEGRTLTSKPSARILLANGATESYKKPSNSKPKISSLRTSKESTNLKMKTALAIMHNAVSSNLEKGSKKPVTMKLSALSSTEKTKTGRADGLFLEPSLTKEQTLCDGKRKEATVPKVADHGKVQSFDKPKIMKQKNDAILDTSRKKRIMATSSSAKQPRDEKKKSLPVSNSIVRVTKKVKELKASSPNSSEAKCIETSTSASRAEENIPEENDSKGAAQLNTREERVLKPHKLHKPVKPLMKSASSKKLQICKKEIPASTGKDKEQTDKRNPSNVRIFKSDRTSKTSTLLSNDKLTSPQKLTFRRGKVVSIQSQNEGPRRLKFKSAKFLGDNRKTNREVGNRSFTKRRGPVVEDSSASNSAAPAVVLRHQDVQDKKNNQGLFNYVIEETASKLVEARKSKVKALVGAFETVISLQESKAMPQMNSL